jgi:hypothetical protein
VALARRLKTGHHVGAREREYLRLASAGGLARRKKEKHLAADVAQARRKTGRHVGTR